MNKNIIKRNFSRYAHLYDKYASVQRIAAYKLTEQIPADGIMRILEIGCGTGNYTSLLREKFRTASIKALDISEKMIEIARQKLSEERVEFIVADAEKTDMEDEFNLITSNAALQWFEDIEKAMERYKDVLSKKGVIAFSVFGPLTFSELNRSLREALNENLSISSHNFLEKEGLKAVLEKYFRKSTVEETVVKEKVLSLPELLKKIKYTGARGENINGFLWNQSLLKKTERIYKSMFGQIEASYQIFFCKAVK